MGFYKTVLLFLVICYYSYEAISQPIEVENTKDLVLIGKYSLFYEDTSAELTVENIQTKKFIPFDKDIFSGPASKSAFWFKFKVRNLSAEDLWLELGSNYIWYADLYTLDSLGQPFIVTQTGTLRPIESRHYDVNFFWMPLSKVNDSTIHTYYLRVKADLPYQLPISIGTIRALYRHKSIDDFLTAGFIGAMLIMFLYNLFIFISTKDRTYFWYLGYIFFMSIGMLYANGYPFIEQIKIGSIDFKWWNQNFLIWHPLAYLFVGMFCLNYLKLKEHLPKFRILLLSEILFMALLLPVLSILGIKLIDLVPAFQFGVLSIYITCLAAGYILLFKRNVQARFYVLGWTFMIIHVFIFFGTVYGVLPYNTYTHNCLYFGVMLETWMFSLALGDRMNILRKEKEESDRKYKLLLQKQNVVLEDNIKERTLQLQNAFEELEVSNEQLEKQAQQLELNNKTKDKLLSIISHDLRSPIANFKSFLDLLLERDYGKEEFIKVAARIRQRVEELYYMMNNLLSWANKQQFGISTNKEVFAVTGAIERNLLLLKELADNKSVSIIIDAHEKFKVACDPNQFDVIIMNLLTNAIKFSPHQSEVHVQVNKKQDYIEFKITDFGSGMSSEKADTIFDNVINESTRGTDGEKGSGIGLVLCKDFVTNNGGNIRVESTLGKGSAFYFTLPGA